MKRQYIKPEQNIYKIALQKPLATSTFSVKDGEEDADAGVREYCPRNNNNWDNKW